MKKLLILFTTFLIASCGGGGGGGGDSTPAAPSPIITLSAEPILVLVNSTSTLTWSSTNSTACSASWTNKTSTSGSEEVTISTAGDNAYSITCTGAGGSSTKSITANNLGTFVNTGFLSTTISNGSIPDNSYGTVTQSVSKPSGSNGIVEFVTIGIDFAHAQPWSVGLRLQSPGGTVVNLMQPFTQINNPGGGYWINIGASAFYGESMEGTWTLEISDYSAGTVGTLNRWGIRVYGN
tara:strand:+ start:604 stop:1314 length:711 start_codon:yes stop_codon:yes gene_type:complete